MESVKEVQYVVVVHGMGNARKNETVLGVVNRFADARARRGWPEPPDVVTLGAACGQTGVEDNAIRHGAGALPLDSPLHSADGTPWLEFERVPARPGVGPDPSEAPFIGEASRTRDGNNIRFVDIHWKQLMSKDYPSVGQSPDVWIDGLLGRLRRRAAYDGMVPQWALEVLGVLRETVAVAHACLKFRARSLDDTVFGTYLGDVQLYGEYPITRGRAVRQFHEVMASVHWEHWRQEEVREREALARGELYTQRKPVYTIIAHSLGTVMSMDALMYAHAKWDVLIGRAEGRHVPRFPGYITAAEQAEAMALGNRPLPRKMPENLQFLDTLWLSHVKSFVTLGSPIDKFLVIWWLNYQYLLTTSWIDYNLRPRIVSLDSPDETVMVKIPHFNYAEAQDPVGDNLNVARTAPAFCSVFQAVEDKVYVRYAIPGLAHTQYWHDQQLFDHIVGRAVDKDESTPDPMWFSPQVFRRIMTITYWFVPIILISVQTVLFAIAYDATAGYKVVTSTALLAGAWLVGRFLIDLVVWWRVVLNAKQPIEASVQLDRDPRASIDPALRGRIVYDPINKRLTGFNLFGSTDEVQRQRLRDALRRIVPDVKVDELLSKSRVYWINSQPGWLYDLLMWLFSIFTFSFFRNKQLSRRNEETAQRNCEESRFRGSLLFFWMCFVLLAAALCMVLAFTGNELILTDIRGRQFNNLGIDLLAQKEPHIKVGRLVVMVIIFTLAAIFWRKFIRRSNQAPDAHRLLPTAVREDFHSRRANETGIWRDLLAGLPLLLGSGAIIIAAVCTKDFAGLRHFFLPFDEWTNDHHLNMAPLRATILMGIWLFSISATIMGYTYIRLQTIRKLLISDRSRSLNFASYAADDQRPIAPSNTEVHG